VQSNQKTISQNAQVKSSVSDFGKTSTSLNPKQTLSKKPSKSNGVEINLGSNGDKLDHEFEKY